MKELYYETVSKSSTSFLSGKSALKSSLAWALFPFHLPLAPQDGFPRPLDFLSSLTSFLRLSSESLKFCSGCPDSLRTLNNESPPKVA